MRSVIFGDVVPKLAELVEEGMLDGPLIDQQAIDWDLETLSEEQLLVQPLYYALSESDLQDLYDIAELGSVASIGGTFTLQLWVPKGPYNKANRIPCFKGVKLELKSVEPRWRYGTMIAASFSTLRAQGVQGPMYTPPQAYQDGSLFAQLNVRPGIHALRAELDGPVYVDYTKVEQLIRSMTPQERREAAAESRLMEAFRTRLSEEQYERIPKLMNGE